MPHSFYNDAELARLDRAIRLARYQSRLRDRLEHLARIARIERRIAAESAKILKQRGKQ